jgi:hypothetical protein
MLNNAPPDIRFYYFRHILRVKFNAGDIAVVT